MTDNVNIAYNRSDLVTALRSAIDGARIGTAQIRSLIDNREKEMDLVAVELTSVFYELGYSDENKDFFNGSFRSMLRNALKTYGSYSVKVSYKRTREYTDGDRELVADNSGNWFWHVQIDVTKNVKSDDDYQAVAESNEVVGQPAEVSETELAINKVLESGKIDRAEATLVMLRSLTDPSAALVVQRYLEDKQITNIREIRKSAAIAAPDEALAS